MRSLYVELVDKGSLLQGGGRDGGLSQKGVGGWGAEGVDLTSAGNAFKPVTASADSATGTAHVHDIITCVTIISKRQRMSL